MPRHLIETTDFSKQEIQKILDLAEQFLDGKMRNTLKDHIIIM